MLSAIEWRQAKKEALFKQRGSLLCFLENMRMNLRMLFMHVHTDTIVSLVYFAIPEGHRPSETSFQQVRNAGSFCHLADPTLHSRLRHFFFDLLWRVVSFQTPALVSNITARLFFFLLLLFWEH